MAKRMQGSGPIGLRLRVMLFFALLAVGAIAAMIVGAWTAISQSNYVTVWDVPGLFESKVQGWLFAGFLILMLVGAVWHVFDTQFVRAIDRLAVTIRARAHVDTHVEIADDPKSARFLGDLGPAAAELGRSLADTRKALNSTVARETSRLTSEKALLETLIADVPVGVILCSGDFDLVFYNGQAVTLLGATGGPGLGRSLLEYLRPGPIRHAYARLERLDDPEAMSDLLCATLASGRLLVGRMRVLSRVAPQHAPGFVLTLRDVTAEATAHAARDALLADMFDRIRRPVAALQSVAGLVAEDATLARQPALNAASLAEIQALGQAVTELGQRYDATLLDARPMAQVRARDLMDGISAQFAGLGLGLTTQAPDLMLGCDGFELALWFRWLGARLSGADHARDFVLRLTEEDGPGAMLDLIWQGQPLPMGQLEAWLADSLDPDIPDLTAQTVLRTHATDTWSVRLQDGRCAVRLPIARARRATSRPAPVMRDVVYDFDLLSKQRSASVLNTRLQELTYVVFDTETTGLDPSRDRIVQLAAVRIVNGRRLRAEVFETLVDPLCAIPPESTAIHGITDDMVKGAPIAQEAARRFYDFARGAVLVAHHAPFDMAFLRRLEADVQLRFDHPVLDTLLLSAIAFGQAEAHSLDALSARLGVSLPEEERHTAIGDAVATADSFLRLIPVLKAKGLDTFAEVLAEMRRHGTLLADPYGVLRAPKDMG